MNRIAALILLMTIGSVIPSSVLAQSNDMKKANPGVTPMQGMDMKSMDMNSKDSTQAHKGIGVVKTINKADGVVTLSHEPIKSLSWPAMTMGFKVKDKILLDKIKPGDKVEFTLVQAGKDYVITSIK